MERTIGSSQLLSAFKAAGEITRLRILALLSMGEHNVTDLTRILGQSQPRISRHLRLLSEARLIERFREGSYVFCRLADHQLSNGIVNEGIALLDKNDPIIASDIERAKRLQIERAEASQVWFRENASKWDEIRSLHVAENKVEEAMVDLLPKASYDLMLDLGTGTGRMLELFADRVKQAIGIDTNHYMLDYARSRLAQNEFEHCQVRQGDITNMNYESGCADLVILHQVLHYLIKPEKALAEAGRLLKPGGHLLVVDFASHDLDFLREKFAHERLGFDDRQVSKWFRSAGLDREESRQLEPADIADEQKLTVSLWLARRLPNVVRRQMAANEDQGTINTSHDVKGTGNK